ncbi:MAG: hypothetical protein M3Y64_01925 [Gemmatimonadota bacterium]|nr:hypothetical protein [Gemmatimonadota bacterium]
MSDQRDNMRGSRWVRWQQRMVSCALGGALVASAACGDHASTVTAVGVSQVVVHIIAGDKQVGSEGDTLQPIVAQVTDQSGVPQKGVAVAWTVNDAGFIRELAALTDELGNASALWTLGREDEHDGVARVAGGAASAFSAADEDNHTLDLFEVGLVRPRTYDGSRETVHPDFVRTPDDWGAYRQHLALTPYPNGVNKMENPSLFVSRQGNRWVPQAGAKNPVVSPPEGSYLSDPDAVYVPTIREMWIYYRQVDSRNRVLLVRSKDGVKWDAPTPVLDVPNHMLISPAVVRRDDKTWNMWSVNGGTGGCSDVSSTVQLRHSVDGIKWSSPVNIDLSEGELTPWHIEVQWIPTLNQYWAVYPMKAPSRCATQKLYFATSADGVKWTRYHTPLLQAGELKELNDIVYRSTFDYNPATDEVRFWFSGANSIGLSVYDWRTVLQRMKRSDLFGKVTAPKSLVSSQHSNHALPVMINPP